jgi:prepilin-type N-terminal cleavage/methylation domain-containing protein
MRNKFQQRGFTLIELLVVIVILGILSTISVGTFRSYFAKARDSERVSAVQSVAMMIKVDSGGNGDCTVYNYDMESTTCLEAADKTLAALFTANDYDFPNGKNALEYYYAFKANDDNNNDFFIAIVAEETGAANGKPVSDGTGEAFRVFADGTIDGVAEAQKYATWGSSGIPAFACPTGWVCAVSDEGVFAPIAAAAGS